MQADDVDLSGGQGYEATFDPELDRKYVCPICFAAMRDAMQTSCGHRFCETCIMAVVNGRSFVKCPVDNMWFRCEDELFADNAVRREILSLGVRCRHADDGCPWKGELRDLKPHTAGCDFLPCVCPNDCGETTVRASLTAHLETCELRSVPCRHCHQQLLYADIMKHEVLVCAQFPVRCTLCGQFGIRRQDIQRHLDRTLGDCPQAEVSCQYDLYGCTFQDKRQNMGDHYKDSPHLHLSYVTRTVAAQGAQIGGLNDRMLDQNRTIDALSCTVQRQTEQLRQLMTTSFDGRCHWRVALQPDVNEYRSPSFYTGRPGYRVCATLEFSVTQADARDGYTSLFVILEKGMFDDDLRFPFNAVSDVTVYDQTEAHGEPENHKSTIQCVNVPRCRTDDEMSNSRRGCLRFMLTNVIFDKYVKDGTIFMDIAITFP